MSDLYKSQLFYIVNAVCLYLNIPFIQMEAGGCLSQRAKLDLQVSDRWWRLTSGLLLDPYHFKLNF